jgi:hypothetical protein
MKKGLYYRYYTFTLVSKGGTMPINTLPKTATTDMEVTSIRLERELKDRLKAVSGNQGYQALVRDILWNYVNQKSSDASQLDLSDLRAKITATAQKDERCALTGQRIRTGEAMVLGLLGNGNLVPLSSAALS